MNNSTSKKWFKNPVVIIVAILILLFCAQDFRRFPLLLGWIVAIAVLVFIVKTYIKSKSVNLQKMTTNVQEIDTDFWKSLGDNREAREKNIKRLFDDNKETIPFSKLWVMQWNPLRLSGDNYIQFRISRNIAKMEKREKEFLRSTFLLYNEGKLDESQWEYYRFAFINGDGKASIDACSWNVNEQIAGKIGDSISAVRYYQDQYDASVDSAINNFLSLMNSIEKNSDEEDQRNLRSMKNRVHGNHSWLSDDDLEDTLFNNDGEYKLNLGFFENSSSLLNYSGEGSLITIAPPGSGKTQCFVIPNMLNWKGAAVVLDIKGEIYTATHKWREKNVGKVYKFSPLEPNNSNSYNPLTFVRDEPDYIWEDARFLADMMIVPSSASDPFWENMARDVLTAAIAHVTFNNEPDNRAMSKVLDIIYGIGWDEMIISLKTNVLVSSMRRMGSALEEMERKQRDSILKTAQSSLSAWQGERIVKVTNKSDWNPLDLRNGTPTIYICINPNEIESYLSLIRVFIAQHIRMLTTELPQRGAAPVLFMLDELPRLKKMPPVDEALNIGRQYGIKLWMFAQSYGQLKDAYPDPEGLIGSCVVRTFMNLPLNDEYTTKISDQLGYRHDALGNTKEKLVEPIELAGPNYRDYILVMATGTKPAKVKKKFAYEDEEIKAKMN